MISRQNAQKLIEDYNYLIGEHYEDLVIKTLIITPRNDPEFSKAIIQYSSERNSSSVYPANSDSGYTVTAILDANAQKTGIYPHAEIFSILEKKGIYINHSDYGIDLKT